jgi:hypothetical protein
MADTPSNRIRLPCLLLLVVLITACLLTAFLVLPGQEVRLPTVVTNIGAPTTDIDGVPRPQGKAWDRGPYEYVSKKA